jgi:hypothetical protein
VSAPAAPDAPDSGGGFSPKVVLALLLAGVFAAAAFLVLSAYAPDLRSRHSAGAHAVSTSAVGYAGVVRLLQLFGEDVRISRSKAALSNDFALVVETPEPMRRLDALPEHQPRLIVLPKWQTISDPSHPGWVREAGVLPDSMVLAILPPSFGKVALSRGPGKAALLLTGQIPGQPPIVMTTGEVASEQTLSGDKLKPLLTDAQGGVILAQAPVGAFFILSDPDLLNTQGVADPATARVAVAILEALKADNMPIEFDVTLNGIGDSRGLLKTAMEPPFLGATLSLLAVAALVGVQAWNRFGAPRPADRAVALGKTALVENGASMVRLARREPRLAPRYVRLCRRRAALALGAANLPDEELDPFLDRWAEQAGVQGRITALTAQAAAVKDIGALVTLAHNARRWRLEMTREPG